MDNIVVLNEQQFEDIIYRMSYTFLIPLFGVLRSLVFYAVRRWDVRISILSKRSMT